MSQCALKGSKTEISSLLNASFDNQFKMFNFEAQKMLTITQEVNGKEVSILLQAVINPNEEVIKYLISNFTHLIQELPYHHRINISEQAMEMTKIDTLCDLLELLDFPFPNSINESSVIDQRLFEILNDRKIFHKAIKDGDNGQIQHFISQNQNLKFVFNIDNKSALACAMESKKFKIYVDLKSRGFKAKENEIIDVTKDFKKKEKLEIKKQIWQQTQKNVAEAKSDSKKILYQLRSRSFIHNRTTTKEVEDEYRKKIEEMFEDINKIPLCSKFLNVVAQCEDFKIIFDFESESVENVDLKNGPHTLGTTYPISKWIIIGAKETLKYNIKNIEGVLMHEIAHYVMRLIYENMEKPYYKNDKNAQNRFDQICKSINIWTSTEEGDDEADDESADESYSESSVDEDDKCDGIISSVFTHYEEKDYHPELIVRPLQILAQYSKNGRKLVELTNKYKQLFDYIDRFILPEIENFNLSVRKFIRKFNKMLGDWSTIENENFQFKSTEHVRKIFKSHFQPIISNLPKLAISNIFQYIQNDNLPDTSNIFISSEALLKDGVFDDIKSVLCETQNIPVIVDCSKGLNDCIKQLYELKLKLVIVLANREQHSEFEKLITSPNVNYKKAVKELNYSFEDLTLESQRSVIQKKINFQNNQNITLEEIIESKTTVKGDEIDENVYKNVIDDQLLRLIVESLPISINSTSKAEDNDEFFDILFQSRKLIQRNCKTGLVELVSENDLVTIEASMKTNLISDLGGTGKTWMLKRLTKILHKQVPKDWVTYVDLKQYIQAFKDQKMIANFSHFICEKILKLKTNYEKQIFNLLYKNGRVTVLFDGFDEIPQDCVKCVLNLIKSFQNDFGNRLWIATRNYCEDNLQNEIKFDAIFNLEEFTEENGIDLVVHTWLLNETSHKNYKLKSHPNYVKYKKVVQKLGAKLPNKKSRSIGFPLFYKMIANVYISKKDSIDILTVFVIVEGFVNQQCRRWMVEKGEPGIDAAIKSQANEYGYFQIHQLLALRSLFPEKKKFCNLEDNKHKWSDKEINKCGLVTKNGEVVCFQYEIIREFLVAQFVLRILSESPEYVNGDFITFLEDILSNYKFSLIRIFINDGLNQVGLDDNTDSSLEIIRTQLKCETVLPRVFKEGHAILMKMFMPLTTDFEHYQMVEETLNKTIKEIIEVTQNSKNLINIINHIMNFLKIEDLEKLFIEQEVFQNITNLRSDLTILEDVTKMLKNKAGERIVKKSLGKICLDSRNIFYFLIHSDYFDDNNFKLLFPLLQKYLNQNQIAKMMKICNSNMRNILHTCVEVLNEEKLVIMWKELQQVCERSCQSISFKELIVYNESVLHVASSRNNLDFHKTLWKLILQINQTTTDLKNLVLQKDHNGSSFLHLLIENKNPDTLNCSLKYIKDIPSKDVLNLKNKSGKNLLHLSISTCKSEIHVHKVLWSYIKNQKISPDHIKRILLDIDYEQNNLFQLMALHSTKKVFTYIIQEISAILPEDEFIVILKNLNNQNKNLVQIALRNNFDLKFHEQLWKILNKHLDSKEMLDIVESIDTSGNTLIMLAVLYNNQSCVELTWNEITNYVKGKIGRHEYLNKDGLEGRSLLELSKKNKHEDVTFWVGELLNKVTIIGHPYGESINILRFEDNNEVIIEDEKLQQMLLHVQVRNRKIVAFSIIGALRKGKSFFLNYCLRFLYAHYPSINFPNNPVSKQSDWIGAETESLKGFSWRSGLARDTRGITIWDDVFLHTNEFGQKIAIIVIDSQGLFDHETSQQNNSKIFAIDTLISSIQVFNISTHFQKDQLEHLQFAADYAKFPKYDRRGNNSKCFQSLMFLIRDWPHQKEYNYGIDDGEKYMNDFFKTSNEHNKDLKHVKSYVQDSFENLSCWLLPSPGFNVTMGKKNRPDYDGNHKEMDTEFKTELIRVIEHLLSPKNLVIKKINNEALTSAKYLKYVTIYFEKFYTEQLPKAQTVYDSTVEQQLKIVIDSCFEEYTNEVKSVLNLINNVKQIPVFHKLIICKAMLKYNESDKMGDKDLNQKFKNILDLKIKKDYDSWSKKLSKKISMDNFEIKKKAELMEAELSSLRKENARINKILELQQNNQEFKK